MTRRTPIGQGVIEYHAPPGPETPGQRAARLTCEAFNEALASPARAETIAHALIYRLEREGLLDRHSATQTAPSPADDCG